MINIDNQQDFLESALLQRAARLTLDLESAPVDADITIVLTDDAQLHELNKEFLGVDAPTDVLSFPASESDPETGSFKILFHQLEVLRLKKKPVCGLRRLRLCQDSVFPTSRYRTRSNIEILFYFADRLFSIRVPGLASCFPYAAEYVDPWRHRHGCFFSGVMAAFTGS